MDNKWLLNLFKNHFYITNDYSLGDNLKYIQNVLIEVNPKLKGNAVKNPIPQSDGAIFASGLDGTEYYLWKSPLL
jgi:ABC-type uncharacterized transport system YnjBCD ATPase subunit